MEDNINPKTGRPKLVINKEQWKRIKQAFNLDDVDMQLQYILDEEVK